jgi:dTDP-4-amino-4,6-dideoxygalactose transaminase
MPRGLIAGLRRLGARFPAFTRMARHLGQRYFARQLGRYPRPLGNEIGAVAQVLHSAQWNMASGKTHEKLEAEFAAYIGVPYAIAVNTGGAALQMSMRALGLKPGHEVLLQVDTCSATAFAIMNAGCTPIFSDISPDTFMLPPNQTDALIGPGTRGLIATHMWGNPEDMAVMTRLGAQHDLAVIEDACLALGARANGRMAGASGKVGVFSFGCVKPIQGGEGGMIVTHDEALARELRSLRHWGDRTLDYGVRDTTQLAWNGRLSEIVAAVVREQLKGYPAYLRDLRDALADFARFLQGVDGLELVLGTAASVQDCAFTQVVLRLDERKLGIGKAQLREALAAQGIGTWHANFEAITSMTFFRDGAWRDWILAGDIARAATNYSGAFPIHLQVYDGGGLGIAKMHFASSWRLKELKTKLAYVLAATR